jgi:hydrogenase expression/formation protein HypC
MAIPSRIIAINDGMATVECFGIERVVTLMLLDEPVELGDYVIVQSGTYAMERIEPEAALEALAYLATVVDDGQEPA